MTTIQHLPIEVLESILVKAILEEVKGLKLAKSVWKDKADVIINRYKTVCQQWYYILDTTYFHHVMDTVLDKTDQETIRLEILHQFRLPAYVYKLTTLGDELLAVTNTDGHGCLIKVYNRNNMAFVKDITLPGIVPVGMASCNVYNCVYVVNEGSHCHSVLRIKKNAQQQFTVAPFISGLQMHISGIVVAKDGKILMPSVKSTNNPAAVTVYSPTGLFQQKILIPASTVEITLAEIMLQNSVSNLIWVSWNSQCETQLIECDSQGKLVHLYQSTLGVESCANWADRFGRILIIHPHMGFELLDKELNKYDNVPTPVNMAKMSSLHYDTGTNELIGCDSSTNHGESILTVLRCTEI